MAYTIVQLFHSQFFGVMPAMQSETKLLVIERHEIQSRQSAIQELGRILSNSRSLFFRKAYRLLGNAADAEDAVQDALLAAYAHLDQFKGESEMSTWLIAIVRNSALMQLRRRPRQVHLSLDEPTGENDAPSVSERLTVRQASPEDQCRHSELRNYLSQFHTQLPPTLRSAFRLRDLEGLSIRETARILGVADGTVKARSSRARKRLRELMRQAFGPCSRGLKNYSIRRQAR